MKTNSKLTIVAIMVCTIAISACKKDKELPKVDENELITTIKLKFTNTTDAADVKTFTWKDTDGQGGAAPLVDEIVLTANKTYKMEVAEILNETTTPAENITEEVAGEDYDHLLVYKPFPVTALQVTITDKDKNNLPVGLKADVITGNATAGSLQVILRHQPDVKNGFEAPGSSDFDITFKVKIE